MYAERLKKNLRPVIEEAGYRMHYKHRTLDAISYRHLWNVEHGVSSLTVEMLESIANEIGVDMMEFFRE